MEQLSMVLAKLSLVLIALAQATSTIPIQENRTEVPIIETDIWEDYPLLKQICSCESAFAHPFNEPRKFDELGLPLWGQNPKIRGATTTDVGVCQISLKYHEKQTKKMGLDVINSLEDNVKYAKYLYDKNGARDWKASYNCHKIK